MEDANKLPKIPYSTTVQGNEKVIRNPHLTLDHHQKFTTSRGSALALAYHVWSTSVTAFVSYPAHSQNDRQTE